MIDDDTVQTTIWIPKQLKHRVKQLALKERRTISSVWILAAEKYLKDNDNGE